MSDPLSDQPVDSPRFFNDEFRSIQPIQSFEVAATSNQQQAINKQPENTKLPWVPYTQ